MRGNNWSGKSRALGESGSRLTLTHKSTGIEVTGEVPTGHYSRREMQSEVRKLEEGLFAELESQVAKALRIPGR